jgi:hypothetical protein
MPDFVIPDNYAAFALYTRPHRQAEKDQGWKVKVAGENASQLNVRFRRD